MKTIGLIGGTSWVSTTDYYRIINQQVNARLGGLHSAKLLLYSMNFEEFKPTPDPDNWRRIADALSHIAKRLEAAGADCILLCANTMHMVADHVRENIHVPLIHIAEVTANAIIAQQLNTVALLGTKFTMEQSFFKGRLLKEGINTLIPGDADRDFIHASIFDELGKGIFKVKTKKRYLSIINSLQQQGAEGVVFGCTEIPMLIKPTECNIPVFDTTLIHATAAVEFALK